MKWEEMFLGKCFISDLGEDQVLENKNKEKIVLGRYAAWAPLPGGKSHQIVEISDDLETLKENTTFRRTEFVFLLESGGYI